jgi:hypothetical protein
MPDKGGGEGSWKGVNEAFESWVGCDLRSVDSGNSIKWKVGTSNFSTTGNPRKGALMNRCDILQQSASL